MKLYHANRSTLKREMNELEIDQVLEKRNAHKRDAKLNFNAKYHSYQVIGDTSKYTSVTKIVHSQFPVFNADDVISKMMKGKNWKPGHKYWGMTPEQIKTLWTSGNTQKSNQGTSLHENIEMFMNQDLVDENDTPIDYDHQTLYECYLEELDAGECADKGSSVEWLHFLRFIKDHPTLTPYRTEWKVFHEELKLAGAIDMLYKNDDGTYSIYDWKRCGEIKKENNFENGITPFTSHIPHSNFWHYSLQLSTYKRILELKYDVKIRDMFLVKLHPDSSDYELIQANDMSQEVNDIFNARKSQLSYQKK